MSAPTDVRTARARADTSLAAEGLLILITQGDVRAFDELYRVQLPLIRSVILRLVCDFHQAEEVAQEVMLQVWQLAHHFDPSRGSAATWMNQIARTRAIDRIRHSQAVRRRDQWDADHNQLAAFDVVSESALLHLDVANLHRGLSCLTNLQREAVVLAFFTDLGYREIADRLDIPMSTLKTRVRDGLNRMRKKIEELDRDHACVA